MKSLKTQIRLGKWEVDEAQRHLAELRRREADLTAKSAVLEDELERERTAPERSIAHAGYAAYVERGKRRRAELAAAFAALADELAAATDALAEAFGGMKKYELLDRSIAEAKAADAARRDQQLQNEIGLGVHRRKESGE